MTVQPNPGTKVYKKVYNIGYLHVGLQINVKIIVQILPQLKDSKQLTISWRDFVCS